MLFESQGKEKIMSMSGISSENSNLINPEKDLYSTNVNISSVSAPGDIKVNRIANPNISQIDVSNTEYSSRSVSDTTNLSTTAGRNAKEDKEESSETLSPDTQRVLNKSVITNNRSVSLQSGILPTNDSQMSI